MKITWHLDGWVRSIENIGFVQLVDKDATATVACAPQTFGDTAYSCSAESEPVSVFRTYGTPFSPYAKITLHAKFSITPDGAIVDRAFQASGMADNTRAGIGLGLLAAPDVIKVPCSASVGSPLSYRLSNLSYQPQINLTQQPYMQVGVTDMFGVTELPGYDGPATTSKQTTIPALALHGNGGNTYALGNTLPNTTAPLVQDDGTFYGLAGQPITFSLATEGPCAIQSWEGSFDDGTMSYGKTPSRAFSVKGWHSGQVTVTDVTGLKTKQSFTYKVS